MINFNIVFAYEGRRTEKSRWNTCMQLLYRYFSVPLGALYVKTYFDQESKKLALEMIQNIRTQFMRILSQLDWMDEQTRTSAMEKAHTIRTLIGYSDEILEPNKVMDLYQKVEKTISKSCSMYSNFN